MDDLEHAASSYTIRHRELTIRGARLRVAEIEGATGAPDVKALHALVRTVVRGGELIVLREDVVYHPLSRCSPLDCIGDCASIPLSLLDNSVALADKDYANLVGSKHAIQMICSWVPLSPSLIREPRVVTTDFRRYAYLRLNLGEHTSLTAKSRDHMLRLGRALGAFHRLGVIHGDAHRKNFIMREDGKVAVIDANFIRVCPPPISTLCATDLVPLISEMAPASWQVFRRGYLIGWPEGRPVVDLIEHNDQTGWVLAMESGNSVDVLEKLDQALTILESDDVDAQANLLNKKAQYLVEAGRPEEALTHIQEAVEISLENDLPESGSLRFNLAVAHILSGNKSTAHEILTDLASDSGPHPLPSHFADLITRTLRQLDSRD